MGRLEQRVLQIFCEEMQRLCQTGARWTQEVVRVEKVVQRKNIHTKESLYNAPVTSEHHRDVVPRFDPMARYF